ncbi:MAG: nicotinate-nucleotide--dimethylbenzimidazole phosphoribosyltransferase, partial [Bilophila sp.]
MQSLIIPPLCVVSEQAACDRLDNLAKVPHSLGVLETLAIRLAGMTGQARPLFPKKSVVLFAADHDITLNGLSATGQNVTTLQVRNFLKGGGTINAFTRNAGADLVVVDVGVKTDFSLDECPNLIRRKVVHAAQDFSTGAALTREEALACLQVGIDMARAEAAKGVSLLAAGEMGIGNTSPSSAIAAVTLGVSVENVTGVGSGITPEAVARKIDLIKRGIALNKPDPHDGVDMLAKVGGPELGAMAGLMLGGASLRIPVVVDGFIAGAAAALAVAIQPEVRNYLVGSHVS